LIQAAEFLITVSQHTLFTTAADKNLSTDEPNFNDLHYNFIVLMSYLFRFCGFHHKYHPFIFGFKELNFPTLVDWIWLIEWSKVLDSCLPAVLADPPTVQ
jgi:hypothetical protein